MNKKSLDPKKIYCINLGKKQRRLLEEKHQETRRSFSDLVREAIEIAYEKKNGRAG